MWKSERFLRVLYRAAETPPANHAGVHDYTPESSSDGGNAGSIIDNLRLYITSHDDFKALADSEHLDKSLVLKPLKPEYPKLKELKESKVVVTSKEQGSVKFDFAAINPERFITLFIYREADTYTIIIPRLHDATTASISLSVSKDIMTIDSFLGTHCNVSGDYRPYVYMELIRKLARIFDCTTLKLVDASYIVVRSLGPTGTVVHKTKMSLPGEATFERLLNGDDDFYAKHGFLGTPEFEEAKKRLKTRLDTLGKETFEEFVFRFFDNSDDDQQLEDEFMNSALKVFRESYANLEEDEAKSVITHLLKDKNRVESGKDNNLGTRRCLFK